MRCFSSKARTWIALPWRTRLRCPLIYVRTQTRCHYTFFKGFLLCNRPKVFVALHTEHVPTYYTASSALLKSNSLYLMIYAQNNSHWIAPRHDLQIGALASDLLNEKYISIAALLKAQIVRTLYGPIHITKNKCLFTFFGPFFQPKVEYCPPLRNRMRCRRTGMRWDDTECVLPPQRADRQQL